MASRGAEAFKMSPDPVSESKDLQGRHGRQRPTSFRRVRRSWKDLQGRNSWQGMVPPEYPFTLDDDLKETLVRYGEFAQATYDAFDWNYITSKRTAGTCKYSMAEMLEEVGLAHSGYEVTDYLYSTVYKWRWPWDHTTHPLSERYTSVEGEVLVGMQLGPAKKLKPTASNGAATLWSFVKLCLGVIFAPLLIPIAVARWIFSQRAVKLFLSFFVPFLTGLMLLPAQLLLGLLPLPNLLAWVIEFVVERIPSQTLLVPYTTWIGFVAESGEAASKRLGRRDIVVAWRGTMSADEWLADFTDLQVPLPSPVSTLKRIAPVDAALGWLYRRSAVPTAQSKLICEGAQVELGFWNLYTRRSRNRQPGVDSARSLSKRAVMARLHHAFGRGEEDVSVTVTGHSLGGALATLSAYDLAQTINRKFLRHVPVTAFTFASPRVGNSKFKTDFEQTPNLRQLRVVNRKDVVPKAPGLLFNENASKLGLAPLLQALIDDLPWTYSHVGEVLEIDTTSWPGSELLQHHDVANFHCLEAYLYILDNTRDHALVNKWSYYLDDNLGLPGLWWQEKNKCVVKDPGTQRLWQPRRDWDHTAKLINRLPRY